MTLQTYDFEPIMGGFRQHRDLPSHKSESYIHMISKMTQNQVNLTVSKLGPDSTLLGSPVIESRGGFTRGNGVVLTHVWPVKDGDQSAFNNFWSLHCKQILSDVSCAFGSSIALSICSSLVESFGRRLLFV